jgi:hypothetical protein
MQKMHRQRDFSIAYANLLQGSDLSGKRPSSKATMKAANQDLLDASRF